MSAVKSILREMYYSLPRHLPFDFIFPCRNVVIEITYACNLDCQMCCFLREMEEKKDSIVRRSELSSEQFVSVISRFPRKTNFAFTGGEPFVKKGFIDVVRAAKSRGCQITIGTNGVLLDSNRTQALLDLGVEQVCFSLDGTPEMHDRIRRKQGAFDALFENAKKLQRLRDARSANIPRIMVNAVILPDNHMILPETVKLMKEMGADLASIEAVDGSFERSANRLNNTIDFSVDPMPNIPRIPREELRASLEETFGIAEKLGLPLVISPRGMTIDDLLSHYEGKFSIDNWSCSIPWNTCRISPYGDLYPCLNYSVGNVLENSPQKLWSSQRYFEFRKPFRRCNVTPACAGCCKLVRK